MSIVLSFKFPHQVNLVTQVVALFDPSPAFQYTYSNGVFSVVQDAQLSRDTTVASAGFAATDILSPAATPIPLPANAFVVQPYSKVYGGIAQSNEPSVLQVITANAKIEPGFSRLRVEYNYYDANNALQTDTIFFDCPFYEGFNVTARELNNLRDYVEQSNYFLQQEINQLQQEVKYALSREFWRGTSVSGQLQVTPITQGLTQGSNAINAKDTMAYTTLSGAAFSGGSSGISISPVSPAVQSQGQYSGGNSVIPCEYYWAEGVDNSTGQRVIVMVLWAEWWTSSMGALDFCFEFSAQGGAVDSVTGVATTTAFAIHANTPGSTSTQYGATMSATVDAPPGPFGTPYSNGVQFNNYNGQQFTYALEPVWQFGDNTSSPGIAFTNQSSFAWMQTAKFDTVGVTDDQGHFNNTPRIIWYPDNNATSITLTGAEGILATDRNYNQNGLGFVRNQYQAMSDSLSLTPVITGPPTITSISPSQGCYGTQISITGSNFSSKDSAYLAGQAVTLVVNSQTSATVTVPSNCPAGPTQLVIMDSQGRQSSAAFTVLGQPNITSVSPSQAPPTSQVTITGTNFNAQDAASQVTINGVTCQIVSWSNTQVVVVVPSTTIGQTQLILKNDCGESTDAQFVVANPDSVTINPHVATVSEGTTFQFSAQFHTYSNGTQTSTDVTSSSVWSVNGQVGGEAVHGTISQSGLYTAPTSAPPDAITVYVQYFDASQNVYQQDSAVVNLAATPTLTIAPTQTTLQAGTQQKYTATLNNNGTDTDVTDQCTWSVNNTVGGTAPEGTISTSGLYQAPNNLTSDSSFGIEASYNNNGTTLNATASVTVKAAPTNVANMTVLSQVNVYLGDGRYGYVPTGWSGIAHLNQYVYVQFTEQLDNYAHLPVASYMPVQQLTIKTKYATDEDIAAVLYNLNDATYSLDANGNQIITTLRTVVLGFIDPSDGRFHSMWDIANPLPAGPDSDPHSIPNQKFYAEKVQAFEGSHTFQGSLIDYINEMTGGGQKQLDALNARSNVLLAGNCSYDERANKFVILDGLHILGLSAENAYGIVGTIPSQEIEVKPNQYLYIDGKRNLRVGNFADVFLDGRDAKTIIVGAVLDKFYTTWPLLKLVDVDTSNVKALGQTSYMNIGPLLVQWGQTDIISVAKKSAATVPVEFPVKFTKSCVVVTDAFGSEGGFPSTQAQGTALDKFDAKVINTGSMAVKTKVTWIAIGM